MVNKSGHGEINANRRAPALRIALAYTPAVHRQALAALFDFDAMLGRFVVRSSEPLLVQVRLAWWREQLEETAGAASSGDPVLAALRLHFGGEREALVALVDGWEGFIAEPPLSAAAIDALARARAAMIGAFACRAGAPRERAAAERAGMFWALADIASRDGEPRERAAITSLVPDRTKVFPQRRELRGVAVLGGLGQRALRRGEPLLTGRWAALAAFRLGLLGR